MRRALRFALERLESTLDRCFTPACNPLYQLGALGWFFYWLVVVSGIYLYIFYDSGVTDAYESVQRITYEHYFVGSLMRSFHRYASDALVLVVLAHLFREYLLERLKGPRWFAWVTGVAALWLLFAAGISGYWIVWDLLGQYVAIASSEWLDALPLFGEPIARNFLSPDTLSGRFFTLMVFIHIAVPLLLLVLMWLHIHRHTAPAVNPPRRLAVVMALSLLVVSVVQPVESEGPADLERVPGTLALDWHYLAALPLSERLGAAQTWWLVGSGTLVLLVLPWLPKAAKVPVARVNLDNCNGCGRCHEDCPYAAVTMEPRTDGSAFRVQAVVDAAQCVGCGICTGACPTATPMRRRSDLRAGIEQPPLTTARLRTQCAHVAGRLAGECRVMVFCCEHGVDARPLADAGTGLITLPCIGMLPPSFIDFLLARKHVDAVMLTGCREGDCHFRLGVRYTQARVRAERDPYLRQRVPRERVACCFPGVDGQRVLVAALEGLRERLQRSVGADDSAKTRPVQDPSS